MIEQLEYRRLLAFTGGLTASLENGTLTIKGSGGIDFFTMSLENGNVVATADNKGSESFPQVDVERIRFFLKGGSDQVTWAVSHPQQPTTINGGSGKDSLYGNLGPDRILGNGGDDTINARNGNDVVRAGSGDDIIYEIASGSDSASDQYFGGKGTDEITYQARNEALKLSLDETKNDGITGEKDNIHDDIEIVRGGTGNDTIKGSDGKDTLVGNSGLDVLNGLGGDDKLYGQFPSFTLDAGSDTFFGGTGDDRIFSDDTNADAAHGGKGNDTVDSDGGDDVDDDVEVVQ